MEESGYLLTRHGGQQRPSENEGKSSTMEYTPPIAPMIPKIDVKRESGVNVRRVAVVLLLNVKVALIEDGLEFVANPTEPA
jgi:hypothetical protein